MGTSWTMTSTIVGVIIGLVSRPVLVEFVGIDGYGVWASAIAVAAMFSLGGDLGVASALPKIVAERRSQRKDEGTIASSGLLFALFTGAIAGAALLLSSPFIGQRIAFPDFPLLLQIQSVQMPFNFGIGSLLALLQGGRSFRAYSLSTILLASANLFFMTLLLSLGAGLVGVMVASLLSTTLLFALLVVTYRKWLPVPNSRDLRADLTQLVPVGLQLTVSIFLSLIMYQVDVVILSFWTVDPTIVGSYSLAVFVARVLWILPGSIGLTTYPVVSEYFVQRDSRRLSAYLRTALTASCAMTGVLAAGIVLLGRPVLRIAFGPAALPAYGLCLLLLAGTAALGIVRSVAPAILGAGRPGVAVRISAAGAILTSIFSLLITPIAGSSGTAIAVSISFLWVSVALVWATDKYVLPREGRSQFYRKLGPVVAGAIVFSLAAIPFAAPESDSWALVVAGVIWGAGSVALLIASGGRSILRWIIRSSNSSR